jgi:hypothetical protein
MIAGTLAKNIVLRNLIDFGLPPLGAENRRSVLA